MKSISPLFFFLLFLIGMAGCRVQSNPPELVEISPKDVFVGQEVVLTGYQFGTEPTVTIGIATSVVAATIISQDDNTIRIRVPRIPPGNTQIRVSTDEGTSDPLPLRVQQPAPIVASVSPGNGLPGTAVVLTGNYLNQLQRVRFDQSDAVVQDSSAEKVTVLVPGGVARGPLTLAIETTGGNIFSTFIVAGTPQITSLSARQAKPGSELVVKGVNLTDGVLQINGLSTERNLTRVTDTEIRATIPTNATSGRVTVTVFEKLIATSADSLLIVQQPALTNLSARDGIAGDKLILTGQNLRDVTSLSFGSTAATFRVLSSTQLEATVPTFPAPTPLTISVSSVGGTATAADQFFYYIAPSNLTVSPARQLRGRPITITGQNLHRITDVRVNGQSVPITDRIEGSQLLVNVPDNGTSGPVSVINRAGTARSAPIVVVQKPVVTTITPPKARPGERVVLRGDFLLDSQVFFTGSTTPAADGGKNEDTERWVLVPNTAQTGPLRIVNATPENTITDPFAVIRLVTITDFTPKTAAVGGELVFTGQNLSSVTEVRFNGGTSAPAVFRLSGSSLIVTVPAGAATGQICLINDAGPACATSNFVLAK